MLMKMFYKGSISHQKKKTYPASGSTLFCVDPMRRDCWPCMLQVDRSILACMTGADVARAKEVKGQRGHAVVPAINKKDSE
jgi:hypothetical protein